MTSETENFKNDIKVNQFTHNPDKAWDLIKNKINKQKLDTISLDTPIFENKVRFVCISDTHSRVDRMKYEIPKGDVLIHAGDFTSLGSVEKVKEFSEFLYKLNDKFKFKVVIAGNHELTFDKDYENGSQKALYRLTNIKDEQEENDDPRNHLKNCIYLEDSFVKLYGLKIYGSPWSPRFCDWAFNADRGRLLLDIWNKIPDDTDVLITHGPPLGFGDEVYRGNHVGCCELLTTIRERVRPKYHIFGHIHEAYGSWTDGVTNYINASICDIRLNPSNAPILFDIDLPDGVDKKSFELD